MSTMIDVPEVSVIDSSINCLKRLGALTDTEELTPLGLHLAKLGVHPKIGKMLLLASIFSCFDPISSISAELSFKSPFYTVMGNEQMCNAAKRKFSLHSDQLAAANAMREWKAVKYNQRQFCSSNFLSPTTMSMLDRMKSQFAQTLHHLGFLSDSHCDSVGNNRNSKNVDLLKAVIGGGLYPNVAYRSIKIKKGRRIDIIKTTERRNLKLLPSSVNSDPSTMYDPGFLVFHEMNEFTSNFFITETTSNVSPYAILLFGDKIELVCKDNTQYISVGDIIEFRCNRETADIIVELRDGFNRLLENKILESSPVSWDTSEGQLLKAILELIFILNNYDDNEFHDVSDDEDEFNAEDEWNGDDDV